MLKSKDPHKVRAGALGAKKRWRNHVPSVVRLADLRPEEAEVVRALLRLVATRNRKGLEQPDDLKAALADSSTSAAVEDADAGGDPT